MTGLRSLAANAAFFVWGVAINLAWLPSLALPRMATVRGQTIWAKGVLWLARVTAGIRVEIRGAENLPNGPVLIACKHQSLWDTLIWHVIVRDPAIVMKAELLNIPVYGWYCRKSKMIAIERNAGPSALRKMVGAARAASHTGRPVIIFPQGTRVAPGAGAPYLPGTAALYRALGAPCIPVALNSGLFWPRRGFVRRPGTIVLEYLPPIPPGLRRREFMALLEERIETASTALIAPTEPGTRAA
jgi:1-acyl-sn-glycerol-3-phosphate acyltransferase